MAFVVLNQIPNCFSGDQSSIRDKKTLFEYNLIKFKSEKKRVMSSNKRADSNSVPSTRISGSSFDSRYSNDSGHSSQYSKPYANYGSYGNSTTLPADSQRYGTSDKSASPTKSTGCCCKQQQVHPLCLVTILFRFYSIKKMLKSDYLVSSIFDD